MKQHPPEPKYEDDDTDVLFREAKIRELNKYDKMIWFLLGAVCGWAAQWILLR